MLPRLLLDSSGLVASRLVIQEWPPKTDSVRFRRGWLRLLRSHPSWPASLQCAAAVLISASTIGLEHYLVIMSGPSFGDHEWSFVLIV